MRLVVACIRVKRIFDFRGGRSLFMMPRAEKGSPALGPIDLIAATMPEEDIGKRIIVDFDFGDIG